ncbi:hypothetical protein BDZ89DRAFT_1076472 [Hymenopellis radicata]|nr:hypothetical protein BDZ89DRAFT_1076472 [Hymenopellis radicata]
MDPSRSLELCPSCHTSILLTSYPSFFDEKSVPKAFCVPPETQVAQIQNQLPAAFAEIDTVEAEIRRFEALLKYLKKHRRLISTHVSRAHPFIQPSPIRRLPTELLDIIFSYACVDFSTENHRTALRLSVVCSYWRTIVTSTPALWTNIFYGPDGRYSSTIAEHYLDRCGQLPLLLEITNPLPPIAALTQKNKGVDSKDIDVKVLFRLLWAIRQWKIVILRLTDHDSHTILLYLPPDVPEIMKALIVETTGIIDHANYYISVPSSFLSAPAFSSVTFSGCRLSHNTPWERICNLTFDEDDLEHLEHVPERFLANAMDKTLRIRSKNSARTFPRRSETFAPLLVRQLTTLLLELGSLFSTLDKLLGAVIMPDLQDVTLIYLMKDDSPVTGHIIRTIGPNDVVNALGSMIARSKCRLQTLTVAFSGAPLAVPIDDAFVSAHIALLQQCPDLKKLRITEAAAHGPLLLVEELFTVCAGPDAIVEELQSLELVWPEGHEPPSSLISMLQSRSRRLSLSSVVLGIRSGGEFRHEVLDCLNELREQGIQASLW